MTALFERLFLLLLLALDWAADPALLAPALQLLANPWCSTENICPSGGYQRAVLQQSRPSQGRSRPSPALDTASPESARTRKAVRIPLILYSVNHLYVFLSLQR
jgi:hypothetical protein